MAPKKQQSKSEGGGGKKKENNKGGNKAITASNGDDDCADMPPLEDMRKSDVTEGGKGQGGGGEQERKEGKAKIVARWSEGDAPMGLKFPPTKTIEMFQMLNMDPDVGDDKLYSILNEKATKMVSTASSSSHVSILTISLTLCSSSKIGQSMEVSLNR